MGVATGRCKSDITVESIFTLEHHNSVSIIFLVDVLRALFPDSIPQGFVFATAATWTLSLDGSPQLSNVCCSLIS